MKELTPNAMTNSHILFNEFNYFEPDSIEEAIALLHKHDNSAKLIAGGTHLIIQLKMEREKVSSVININKITELKNIKINSAGELQIGACVTIREIRIHPYINAVYPALSQACASFGSSQIEVMGTIGGNLCNGSPASDTVPALLAFGAKLIVKGKNGERTIPAEDFIIKPGKTALQPGEILVSILLPQPVLNTASTYIKITRVTADLAKVSLGISLVRKNDVVEDCKLAFGSVAPTPIRIKKAEERLKGQKLTPELVKEIGKIVEDVVSPIDDVRSTSSYRRRIVNVIAQDALNLVWEQALDNKSPYTTHAMKFEANPSAKSDTVFTAELDKESKKEIQLKVNGKNYKVWVSPNELLLNVIREKLLFTGTKYGCGLGECSACTVHIGGKPALACLVLAIAADGKDITTIEGLQKPNGKLDPLQESFIENGAFQCGYCTPGILMTLKGLLAEMPHPTEEDIRDYLKGNRCRCTGYTSIVRAVMATLK